MKKFSLGILLLLLMSSSLYSYQTTYKEWRDNGFQETGLKCNNGSLSFVYYYPKSKLYYSSSNNTFSNFHDAAKSSCNKYHSKSNKVILIKDGGMFCETESVIKQALESNGRYGIARLKASGNDNGCGQAEGDNRAYFIKQYYLTSYIENGKKVNYIDNYVKVKAADGYFFIRNDDLK